MKTTFKTFLTEDDRSVVLTFNDAVHHAIAHCGEALSSTSIYRGLSYHVNDYLLDNPAAVERKSAGITTNFYTLLMSNSPAWAHLPKRNRALICSTSTAVVNTYGHRFFVLPEDGAVWGVCPKHDMWFAFEQSLRTIGAGDLESFSRRFEAYLTMLFDLGVVDFPHKQYSRDYASMLEIFALVDAALKSHGQDKVENIIDDNVSSSFSKDVYMKMTDVFSKHGVLAALEDIFDPEKHGFTTSSTRELQKTEHGTTGKEIWTSSKAILVYHEVAQKFFDKIRELQ